MVGRQTVRRFIMRRVKVLLLAATVLTGAVAGLAFTEKGKEVRKEVASIFNPESPTNITRMRMWAGSLEMTCDHPLRGVGPGNFKLVYPLYPVLFEQKRLTEALEIMEEYITQNTEDRNINLEIMRVLVMSSDPMVQNAEAGKKYAEWFLANLDSKDVEVLLLLATANLRLGLSNEAAEAVKLAQSHEPSLEMQTWIDRIIRELERR